MNATVLGTFWRAPMAWSMGRNRPLAGNQTDGFEQVFVSNAVQDAVTHMITEARWPNDPDNVLPLAPVTAECVRVLGDLGPAVQPNFVRVNELIVN